MSGILGNFKNSNFLRFWLAQLISQFGDRINQMALVGLVASRHHGPASDSIVSLAKLLSFTIIPVFIIGPIAGVYVDRWDRRLTLFVCDLIRGALVLTIPMIWIFWESMIPIYATVFLVFCLSRFYVPAKLSFIPDIVGENELLVANTLVSVTGMIAFVLGALLGGLIVEYNGARGGFFWDAATFFISASLVFSISRTREIRFSKTRIINNSREMLKAIKKSVFQEIAEGIKYIALQKEIRFIIYVMNILFMAAGAIYVVIIVFVQETFKSVTRDLGIMAVALGVGLLLGSLAYGKWGGKISRFRTIFICLILGGIMVTVFTIFVHVTRNHFIGMGLSLILGFVVGPIIIASNTIVHHVCDEKMRGKVFSALEFVMHLAFLLSMLLSSYLAQLLGRFWILLLVGVVFTIIGIIGLLRHEGEGFLEKT